MVRGDLPVVCAGRSFDLRSKRAPAHTPYDSWPHPARARSRQRWRRAPLSKPAVFPSGTRGEGSALRVPERASDRGEDPSPRAGTSPASVGEPAQEIEGVVRRGAAPEAVVVRMGSVELEIGDVLKREP